MKDVFFHEFFGMLSNPLRGRIVLALNERPSGVNGLTEKLGAERSRISHALLEMKKCRIVEPKKKGRERIYFLNKSTMGPLLKLVDSHAQKNCPYCWAKKENELRKRS